MNESMPVYERPGPLLVLAGPGAGKTWNLAKRIKSLVEDRGVSPNQIGVFAFTTEAARNMGRRISDPDEPETFVQKNLRPRITTLHSLGFRILRDHADALGMCRPRQLVGEDEVRALLLEDAAQLADLERRESRETSQCRQKGSCQENPAQPKCLVCTQYRRLLDVCGAVDYDDQIILAGRLLRKAPEIVNEVKASCRHFLVDEFQDMNAAQFELVNLLTEGQRDGLFAVGDDDQSVYSWRGGNPDYVRSFRKYFGPTAEVVPLSQSFRCHRHVLEGALAVVRAYDPHRLAKPDLAYRKGDGPEIELHDLPSYTAEARQIARIASDAPPSKDVLILVPRRRCIPVIVDHLRQAEVPFTCDPSVPGEGLPRIDTLRKWLGNPADNLLLRKCIQLVVDSRKTGMSKRVRAAGKLAMRELTLHHVSELWNEVLSKNLSLWDSLQMVPATDELGHVRDTLLHAMSVEGNLSDVLQLCEQLDVWTSAKGFWSRGVHMAGWACSGLVDAETHSSRAGRQSLLLASPLELRGSHVLQT